MVSQIRRYHILHILILSHRTLVLILFMYLGKILKRLCFEVLFNVSFIGKPIPDKTNITIGVTFTTGIEFSIKIIAYPVPQYELVYENGTRNNQMLNNITRNAVNNFTVYYRQVVVDQSSFGLYYLTTRNLLGETTVTVNVIEQSK